MTLRAGMPLREAFELDANGVSVAYALLERIEALESSCAACGRGCRGRRLTRSSPVSNRPVSSGPVASGWPARQVAAPAVRQWTQRLGVVVDVPGTTGEAFRARRRQQALPAAPLSFDICVFRRCFADS